MKKEKTPNIRFKKFEHNWFKDCLSKVSNSIEYGLNASAKDFDGIHKYLRITDIDDSSRLFLTDKLSSPDVNFTEEDYENYKLRFNDLLFARTGASVGKTYLYRESDGEVYYAGFLIRARLHDSYDGNFIFQQTLTDKYKQFIEITSQRSGQPGVNGKEYGDWKIGMTSYPEQSAIGSLFRTIDDLLTSYKDNLDNYQSLKATMLSKMFPKAGQTVPEIRLDGFEGEWECLKIAEIFQIIDGDRGKSYPGESDFYSVGHTLFLDTGNVKKSGLDFSTTKFISEEKDKELRNGKLILGDFILTSRGTLGNVAYYNENIQKRYSSVRINSAMLILRPLLGDKISPDYILAVLRGNLISDFMKVNQVGSAQPHITKKEFSKIKVLVPSNIQEQQAIGSYFSNLDNLINSYQEKISQLETLKKKLLQDMFI